MFGSILYFEVQVYIRREHLGLRLILFLTLPYFRYVTVRKRLFVECCLQKIIKYINTNLGTGPALER